MEAPDKYENQERKTTLLREGEVAHAIGHKISLREGEVAHGIGHKIIFFHNRAPPPTRAHH